MNVLITGASRGIGKEFVKQLLAEPMDESMAGAVSRVFALSTHAEGLADLAREHPSRLVPVAISVSDASARGKIEALLKDVALDLLINNAGVYPQEPDAFEEIPLEALRHGFEVNAIAAFRTTQACMAALKRASRPKVVHITSLMGSIGDNASGGHYAYRMSKAALNMFNRSFAADHPGMTAVVLHPGWVRTEMGGSEAPLSPQESVSGMLKVIRQLKGSDSGKFLDYEGDSCPW